MRAKNQFRKFWKGRICSYLSGLRYLKSNPIFKTGISWINAGIKCIETFEAVNDLYTNKGI